VSYNLQALNAKGGLPLITTPGMYHVCKAAPPAKAYQQLHSALWICVRLATTLAAADAMAAGVYSCLRLPSQLLQLSRQQT